MAATIVGGSEFTFAITGASSSYLGVVESVSVTESYTTTVESKNVDGEYLSPAEIHMMGKQAEVTMTGIANVGASGLPKNGDSLTFNGGTISSTISQFYVTSAELSGSAGDFQKITVTGIGGSQMS